MDARVGTSLPTARPTVPGDVVDSRYQLICELGQGGMGVVLLAEDRRLQRRVAIKFLRAQATEADLSRFRREAQLLASLSHPNVVRVFDLGEYQGRPYFVMEFLDGITLAEALALAGGEGLPVDVAIGFGRQLCEALEAVHKQGIIHRDIKPGNVIITAGTTAVLMDFGLARRDASSMDRAQLSGTPQYLAPEDISGRSLTGEEARRSDIYSLGITLYELIAGRPPFSDEDTVRVLHHQLHDPPPPLCDIRPDVPAAFERVIMRALEKDPARRQFSCSELVAELSQARATVVDREDSPQANSMPKSGISPTKAVIAARSIPKQSQTPALDFTDGETTTRNPFNMEMPAAPVVTIGSGTVALVLDAGAARDQLVEELRGSLRNFHVSPLPANGKRIQPAIAALLPACVVIDLDLLEENPFELCASLKANPKTARLPMMVIGEDVGEAQEALLTRMGVSRVLRKPFDPSRLAGMISETVRFGG